MGGPETALHAMNESRFWQSDSASRRAVGCHWVSVLLMREVNEIPPAADDENTTALTSSDGMMSNAPQSRSVPRNLGLSTKQANGKRKVRSL